MSASIAEKRKGGRRFHTAFVAMVLALSLILMTALSACGRAGVTDVSVTPNAPSVEMSPSPEEKPPVAPENEQQETAVATASPVKESEKESEAPVASEPPAAVTDFTFELIDESYEENRHKVFFPQLVSESDPAKADLVNDIIQEDLKAYLAGIRETEADVGNISLELSWTSESMANNALTIAYSGVSSLADALYPQHVYRTVVINLVEPASLALSEVFDVGVTFAEQFRAGLYAPLRDELDLEASGADIPGIIDSLGSMDQLVQLLREPSTPFVLALQGVIVSVPVPHAVGDHLEMAIPYEAIESLMKRDTCSVWTEYLSMTDAGDAQPAMSAFPMLQYRNARFGYTLSYPDLFKAPVESENGDGITLVSADEEAYSDVIEEMTTMLYVE